jgi:hypothetical protein
MDWRIVLRRNVFQGGGGIEIGMPFAPSAASHNAQTISSVLIEGNTLTDGACNVTAKPMPTGADINGYLACAPACAVEGVAFAGNSLIGVRTCS